MEKCRVELLNEYSQHDITKTTLGETGEMFLKLISKTDKKIEHIFGGRTQLEDLLTDSEEKKASTKQPKEYPKMRRKRSKSDISGEVSTLIIIHLM